MSNRKKGAGRRWWDRPYAYVRHLNKHYGTEESKAIAKAFCRGLKEAGDPYCNDAWRFADALNPTERARFIKARSCCGCWEKTVEVNGKFFWVGFNYGH